MEAHKTVPQNEQMIVKIQIKFEQNNMKTINEI